MIFRISAILFAISSGVVTIKNIAANNKIERMGYKIRDDKRSYIEVLISFIKDYFYLLVPGYNIYKSLKLFLKSDKEYANERKSLLEERERLVVKNATKKEEVKAVKNVKPVKKVAPIKKESSELSIYEMLEIHKQIDRDLHEKIEELDRNGCSAKVHNEYVQKIQNNINEYNKLKRQLELEQLREERNNIVLDVPRKLKK